MNKFDFNGIDDFDQHIEMSIPNYDLLLSQVIETIDSLDSRGGRILDLGCSTGNLLKSLSNSSEKVGMDMSRLIPEKHPNITFINTDITKFPFDKEREFSSIVSLFFLQFLTRLERKKLLTIIADLLVVGGRFYCAEKIHYDDPLLDNVTKEIHLQGKREHFSDKDILDKSDQLMRSMWLSTDSELTEELKSVGVVTEIWRSYTFCCKVVTKK